MIFTPEKRFTEAQTEHYYKIRLDPYKLHHSKGMEYRSICPLHPDGDNPNALLVHLDDGHFICWTKGCKGHDIYAFEMGMLKAEGKLHNVDQVIASIENILGETLTKKEYPKAEIIIPGKGRDRSRASARYLYTDEDGIEIYSAWRYEGDPKEVLPDRPAIVGIDPEESIADGRIWGYRGARRVPYHLPDLIQSMVVFAVEGEKNADDLNRAISQYIIKLRQKTGKGLRFMNHFLDHIAVTTNLGGALAWQQKYEYGRYFTGKTVIKLGDNDGPGRIHDQSFCEDVVRFAHRLYKLELPVSEKQDISDYLKDHSFEDFMALWPECGLYEEKKPKESVFGDEILTPKPVMVSPHELMSGETTEKKWFVHKLIAEKSKGLVVAKPKTGKSLFFLDIAVALATNTRVLSIPSKGRRVKVGVISREDGPELVYERLDALARGRGFRIHDLKDYIKVNTDAQTSSFMIDNQQHLDEMAAWIKAEGLEYCIIDVLNKIHNGKENSNDDMGLITRKFDELREKSGAQICVIHHSNAQGESRGASSIFGWADYTFKLESEIEDPDIKKLSVVWKNGATLPTRYMKYVQSHEDTVSQILLLDRRQ